MKQSASANLRATSMPSTPNQSSAGLSTRRFAASLCALFFTGTSALAMTPAPDSVAMFIRAATLLPCTQDIATLARDIGYRATAQTRINTDFADTKFAETPGHTMMTIALEQTPIGTQFSLALEFPPTARPTLSARARSTRAHSS